MRPFTRIPLIAFIAGIASTSTALLAQIQAPQPSSTTSTPKAPLWEVHLHLQKTFASPLGQRLVELVEKDNPKGYQDFIKFAEAIGLDPRTDIGEVAIFGNGFDEDDPALVAQLGKSAGNLEGWILAAPGYKSEALDDNTLLHSFLVQNAPKDPKVNAIVTEEQAARMKNSPRAWFALPQQPSTKHYVLIGSLDRDRTIALANNALSSNPSLAPNPLQGESILSFFVNDLKTVPLKIDENAPGAAILQTITQLGFNAASNDDNLSLALNFSAQNPTSARQLSQLLIGLKAMAQLAPLEEAEAKIFTQLIDSITIDHTEGEPNVAANVSAPYRLIEELLEELQ